MRNLIVGLVVLVVLVGGAFALTSHKSTPKPATSPATNTSGTTNSQTTNSNSANPSQTSVATITYSDSGFSPATITVKAGDTVTIKNTSSGPMQLDSDPHPTHTDDTDLNVGLVASGQSMTFKVDKKGTFGYHNHLNPSDQGNIVVE